MSRGWRIPAREQTLALPAAGRVIAISGGGWGVGDLVGATRAALEFEDATVLCLCGRNDALRAKVVGRFGDEPRLRVMGFTDRMGDVLAAADALVHSSAGLTVLERVTQQVGYNLRQALAVPVTAEIARLVHFKAAFGASRLNFS